MPLIAITGRLPALSIAELESVFGAEALTVFSNGMVQIDKTIEPQVLESLGGTQKVGKILAVIEDSDWHNVSSFIKNNMAEFVKDAPEGKITLGLSVYGLQVNPRALNGTMLEIKKLLKTSGKSVRVVPNKALELNTAQVLHNKLSSPSGFELLLIKNGRKTTVAQTIWIQDIEAYSKRDQARPMRDARVGMLPPKLAQTIIHLSGFRSGQTLLDPFCGTGVLLQETLLMGGKAIGSDLEPRMIEYSEKNLQWLSGQSISYDYELVVADATKNTWESQFDTIACETYLGRPLTSLPERQTLNKIIQDVNTIHKKFLENISRQTPRGFKMCIAIPAWKTANGFILLPVLDHLKELGYNRVSFVHVEAKDLVYFRNDQTVARELVVLERI